MRKYNEDEYLSLSGLQHYSFCRRQWGLIAIENMWMENTLTYHGRTHHKRVHTPLLKDRKKDVITVRGLPVSSAALGVSGECDAVEFSKDPNGIKVSGIEETVLPAPVEYKNGTGDFLEHDSMQLCAQAICLEEMLCCRIQKGYLYYIATNKKIEVEFTEELRNSVQLMANEMHRNYERMHVPSARRKAKCGGCSFLEYCEETVFRKRSARNYLKAVQSEYKDENN